MSTRTEMQTRGSGLSITTLAIASVSSIAAAVFIHKFWSGGAILGAGITPIIVAIVSESLKKPTATIQSIREERRERSRVARRTGDDVSVAPPPELERADPFGIWQEDSRPSRWDRMKGRPLKLALVTGLIAFLIAGFALTGADLVFGTGNGGGDRFIVVPGTQKKSGEDKKTTTTETTETQPAETTPQDEEQPPVETVPQETVPTVPPETTPTPVVPPEQQTVPPGTPAPTTPTPAPEQAPAG